MQTCATCRYKSWRKKEFAKSFVYAAEEGPELYLYRLSVF